MITVAKTTPLSPNARVSRAVASEADRILATLLPSRIAPIIRSLSSVTLSASFARCEPLSAALRNFDRDAAVSAVSDAEKNAEHNSRITIIPAVIQNEASSIGEGMAAFQTDIQGLAGGLELRAKG